MTEGEARRQVARGASRGAGERVRQNRRTTPLLADRERRGMVEIDPEVDPEAGPERSTGSRPEPQGLTTESVTVEAVAGELPDGGTSAAGTEKATGPVRRTKPRVSAARLHRPARVRRLVAVTDSDRAAAQKLLAATAESAGQGGLDQSAAEADGLVEATCDSLEQWLAAALAFVRRRLTGDITVDEFGFDEELTDVVLLNLLRPLYRKWFRVEVRGIENIPSTGGALIVANHSGAIAFDALMTQLAVHDEHPAHRHLRLLGADLVFSTPVLGELARKGGATLANNADAERLLSNGELVAVWPEGFKGIGKPFSERYKLQRFGRGGFVSAALKTGTPIVPCAIVGAEETYPILGNMPSVARLLGLPYAPITPTWPLLGLLGLIPLPSKWLIEFCPPVTFDEMGAGSAVAEDPMTMFDLTDLVRQTIQQALYSLLVQRRSVFF